jgi:hypothetical protein
MNADFMLPGISLDDMRLHAIFHPYALSRVKYAFEQKLRFVHYTTAETAVNIIQSREVWMRRTTAMNDYKEFQYGMWECLAPAYKEHKANLERVLDTMFPGCVAAFEQRFNQLVHHLEANTFITSISEHQVIEEYDEDEYGRLSMWRAYGGKNGVAIVLNGAPFHQATHALNAYTSPVAYFTPKEVRSQLAAIIQSMEANADFLKLQGVEKLQRSLFECFRWAALCTKHPGFMEEREWRIIHSPIFNPSTTLVPATVTIDGIPQKIFKIPLKNIPNEKLFGIEISEIIDRIIIGPSRFPFEIYEALVEELKKAGVPNAEEKVFTSTIPLRQ